MTYAFTTPYLAHQFLALSALHLSLTQTPKRQTYYEYATCLQTRALSHFNTEPLDITDTNCVPLLLFSSLLGQHMLCDALRFRQNDLDTFLDKFTSCLSILRGVHTIVGRASHLLYHTEVGSLLRESADLLDCAEGKASQLLSLWELIDQLNIDEISRQAYLDSIEHPQRLFNVQSAAATTTQRNAMIFSWPVLTSSKYVELLRQQKPGAVVILAHYAMLLHNARRHWLFGDGGRFLIESISQSLGSDWEKWLKVPNNSLRLIGPISEVPNRRLGDSQ